MKGKRNCDWMLAADEVRLERGEIFVLPEASRAAIWESLKKANAPDSAEEDALEEVRGHLERYLHLQAKKRGRVSPATRRKNALAICKAVRRVKRLVGDADRNARNCLYISLAEASDITRGKRTKGKRLFARNIKNMNMAAKSALEVAETQVLPGRPSKIAPYKKLFCELAAAWVKHTRRSFVATKNSVVDQNRYIEQLKFVDAVLEAGQLAKPDDESRLYLLNVGRKSVKGRVDAIPSATLDASPVE